MVRSAPSVVLCLASLAGASARIDPRRVAQSMKFYERMPVHEIVYEEASIDEGGKHDDATADDVTATPKSDHNRTNVTTTDDDWGSITNMTLSHGGISANFTNTSGICDMAASLGSVFGVDDDATSSAVCECLDSYDDHPARPQQRRAQRARRAAARVGDDGLPDTQADDGMPVNTPLDDAAWNAGGLFDDDSDDASSPCADICACFSETDSSIDEALCEFECDVYESSAVVADDMYDDSSSLEMRLRAVVDAPAAGAPPAIAASLASVSGVALVAGVAALVAHSTAARRRRGYKRLPTNDVSQQQTTAV